MSVSIPAIITFDDEGLDALRAALGLDSGAPVSKAVRRPSGERNLDVEFPRKWELSEERDDEAYYWPKPTEWERYAPFTVYDGQTSRGLIRLGIGRCRRVNTWGKDRLYFITFHITQGGKRPLCEFLETDDYDERGETVAIVRGSGSTKREMYDPSRVLPGAYAPLRDKIRVYKEVIRVPRAYNRQAIVAHEDDAETMLNHSLIQADLRFNIQPS